MRKYGVVMTFGHTGKDRRDCVCSRESRGLRRAKVPRISRCLLCLLFLARWPLLNCFRHFLIARGVGLRELVGGAAIVKTTKVRDEERVLDVVQGRERCNLGIYKVNQRY